MIYFVEIVYKILLLHVHTVAKTFQYMLQVFMCVSATSAPSVGLVLNLILLVKSSPAST